MKILEIIFLYYEFVVIIYKNILLYQNFETYSIQNNYLYMYILKSKIIVFLLAWNIIKVLYNNIIFDKYEKYCKEMEAKFLTKYIIISEPQTK